MLSFGLVCFSIVTLSLVCIGFIGSAVLFLYTDGQLERANLQLRKMTANVDAMYADMAHVQSAAVDLESTIDNIAINSLQDDPLSSSVLPIRFDQSASSDASQPSDDMEYVESVIRSAQLSFQNINDILDAQNGFLADIPSIWPLRNNHGHVTLEFGPNRHPKTNQWYLHKGIDIAGTHGVDVLVSANGKVIEAGYGKSGYGNYVLVRHKYGFRTRYSHLSSIRVNEGQDVTQGDIIGTLGNTGISTGPHLDFQIILGTDVIDPAQFLKISRRQFQRWEGNRY